MLRLRNFSRINIFLVQSQQLRRNITGDSSANHTSGGLTLNRMADISRAWYTEMPPSAYMKTYRFHYIQDGIEKSWDMVNMHDGCVAVVHNTSRNKLIFVRQFRPTLYTAAIIKQLIELPCSIDLKKFPSQLGISLELCAGLVDKDKSLRNIIRDEVLEELGYNVPPEKFEKIISFRSGIGISCAKQSLYYVEVTDEQKVSSGGGIHDEIIEIVELSFYEACRLIKLGADSNSPPGLLVGLLWFFSNKVSGISDDISTCT